MNEMEKQTLEIFSIENGLYKLHIEKIELELNKTIKERDKNKQLISDLKFAVGSNRGDNQAIVDTICNLLKIRKRR
jgi:hypothetical protein